MDRERPLSKHRDADSALALMADLAYEDDRLFRGDGDIWIAHADAADKAKTILICRILIPIQDASTGNPGCRFN